MIDALNFYYNSNYEEPLTEIDIFNIGPETYDEIREGQRLRIKGIAASQLFTIEPTPRFHLPTMSFKKKILNLETKQATKIMPS